jgi:hypothetical protein
MRIEVHYAYQESNGRTRFIALTAEDLEQLAHEKATNLHGARMAGDTVEFVRMELGD